MPVQIFVEDELNEPYEILARRALGLSVDHYNRREVKVSLADIESFTSLEKLLDLVAGAGETGYDCVIFIMDYEDPVFSQGRSRKQNEFGSAFDQLCRYLEALPDDHPLSGVNVIRIVAHSCLESWLASDPQAVIRAVSAGRGVRYNPNPSSTENLAPRQSAERIAQHIRRIGIEIGRRDLKKARATNVKRRGSAIARQLDPDRAKNYNRSLRYFFEMVSCEVSGCENPCPELN